MLRLAAYESRTHHHEMHMYVHFFSLLQGMHAGQQIPLDIPAIFYVVSAVQIARDFSKKMIEFAQDVNRPDVSVLYWFNHILSCISFFGHQLAEWLTQLIDERLPEVILVDTVKSCGPMACILHGDFWNNNVLFKYADVEGKETKSSASSSIPVSLKLIDFQITVARW